MKKLYLVLAMALLVAGCKILHEILGQLEITQESRRSP